MTRSNPGLARVERGRARVALALAGICLALGGCASGPKPPPESGRTTEAPNGPEVSLESRPLVLQFRAGDAQVTDYQVAYLHKLMDDQVIGYGDKVLIHRGVSALSEARAKAVEQILQRLGLTPTLAAPDATADGELDLAVEHAKARAPNCPNWTKANGADFANTSHSDFGCSTAADLAAMVADPRDLLQGKPLPPAIGDHAFPPNKTANTLQIIFSGAAP